MGSVSKSTKIRTINKNKLIREGSIASMVVKHLIMRKETGAFTSNKIMREMDIEGKDEMGAVSGCLSRLASRGAISVKRTKSKETGGIKHLYTVIDMDLAYNTDTEKDDNFENKLIDFKESAISFLAKVDSLLKIVQAKQQNA